MSVYRWCQAFCYLCGVAFLLVMLWKRSSMQLTEIDSLLMLLLIVSGTLLFICLGTLSGLAGVLERQTVKSRQ